MIVALVQKKNLVIYLKSAMSLFFKLIIALVVAISASGLRVQMKMGKSSESMQAIVANFNLVACVHVDRGLLNKAVSGVLAGIFAATSVNMPADAITKDQILSLSYQQVKGTGLANRCPEVIGEQTISLSSGQKYKITDLCIEPKTFQVMNLFFCFRFYYLLNRLLRLKRK